MWTVETREVYPETLLAAALSSLIQQGYDPEQAGVAAASAVVACLDRYAELLDQDEEES